jgi:hypothetical protein
MGTWFPKHVVEKSNIEVYKWNRLHKTVALLNSFSHVIILLLVWRHTACPKEGRKWCDSGKVPLVYVFKI